MAIKKKKKKKPAIEMTLWDVVLSYPDLHDPKPYKGKIYYRTDVLLESDDPQLKELRLAIKQVKTDAWGEDSSEWPEAEKPLIQNGDEREDSKGYAGKKFITASTQTPVPVVGPKGKEFNPQMVKGGMFANVAIRISAWEYDGDEGISIYLQGVQIDTSKPSLNFGGGKSVAQMFKRDGDDDDNSEDSSDDDEEDQPRSKKKKGRPADDDDEDEGGSDSDDSSDSDDDDSENEPVKKSSKKKKSKNFDEDDEE